MDKRSKHYKALDQYKKNCCISWRVPSKLPHADFWQKYHFAFDQFEPLTVENGEPIAHLRMDVLQFLLADKLD